ncbi:LppX_LprAFG lipoprotein [Nocardioides sp. zg-1230]|uniref:LppX_LprAFG lipoprotein n=1 Tax=Nocardioides sp. zg-1230 TaxID=2736601 RepID=UPI001556E443|nr:LppX_LprAFG lipoprotein [Nocardioides sp. zg-1230]NPC41985.1 LppX_LprAFG lipoprotein [Nocardioides sp. zg-1230]
MERVRRGAASLAALAALTTTLAACSDGGSQEPEESPEDVLASAKEALDETSGVTLSLTTQELPEGVDGVLEATGVATRAPAFDGDLVVLVNGLEVDVPVVSVDSTVWARLPFTSSFSKVDPADYGAPDPARLMDPDSGLSSWLTAATDVEEGERVRDGEVVLSSYTGTLPGRVVDASIPSADEGATFPATFRIDEDGRLRAVDVSGPFYGQEGTVDYTVSVDDYGTDQDISRP